jgi:hypothetical protein
MRYTDMSIYSATRDMAGGPITVEEVTTDTSPVQPYRNENGQVSSGSALAYLITYGIVAAILGYCLYFL